MSSSRRRLAALLLLAAIALVPGAAKAQAAVTPTPFPAPPPPKANPRGLVWGGAALFVAPYVASAIAASTGYADPAGTSSARGALWVPAVGPFILMGNTSSGAADVLLVLDGLTQIGGLTLFVYALTVEGPTPRAEPAHRVEISIAPLVFRGASGAWLTGTF